MLWRCLRRCLEDRLENLGHCLLERCLERYFEQRLLGRSLGPFSVCLESPFHVIVSVACAQVGRSDLACTRRYGKSFGEVAVFSGASFHVPTCRARIGFRGLGIRRRNVRSSQRSLVVLRGGGDLGGRVQIRTCDPSCCRRHVVRDRSDPLRPKHL